MKQLPSQSLLTIPKELDALGWTIELDKGDVQVYSKCNVSESNIIGFKTITEHAVPAERAYSLLQDVCGAMNQINDMFILGEVFEDWPLDAIPGGSLVRTSFRLPFPLSNREFLHGLHYQKISENCYLVAYTPVERTDIPIQRGFVRCPMYVSGQRITILPQKGLISVEHLMVYELGGSISPKLQDNWMKGAHVGAYIKEWRNLRSKLFPYQLMDINYTQLATLANQTLKNSLKWPRVGKPKYGEVRMGRPSYSPYNAYRLSLDVEISLEEVTRVLADESLTFLPKWNKEFMTGEVLETLEESPKKSAWLIKVQYATPPILSHREYIYYFSREWVSSDEVLILYNSVDHQSLAPKGSVRALLYPSVHRCTRLAANKTKIEHILATDLAGNLGRFQDSLLKSSLIQAQCRDMEHQVALFGKLS